MNHALEEIHEMADNGEVIILADGLEKALIGYTINQHHPTCAIYDIDKCIKILMKRDKMKYEEAVEFLEFNTTSAYVGPHGPLFVKIPK
jgi:hypothetical protein